MKTNKKLVVAVLGILGIIFTAVGVTFAFFSYSKTGTKENSISSGRITFLYTEAERGISLVDAMPMTDVEGKALSGTDNIFDFRVTSSVGEKMEIPYTVTAKVDSTSTFPANYIKVYLTDQSNNIIEPVRVFSGLDNYNNSNTEKVLYSGLVPANLNNYSKDFRLRMWIADNVDMNSNNNGIGTYNGTTFKIKINVYANGSTSEYTTITSVQDFLTAVSTGGKYRLASNLDITSQSTININSNLTLDFNGYIITSGVNQIVVGNSSTLTLNDNRNIGGISCTRGCIKVDGGNVVFNNGTISSSDTTKGSAIWVQNGNLVFNNGYIEAGAMGISAYNSSFVTIENGVIKSSSPNTYAVVFESASLEFNNGWIDGVKGGIFANSNANVVINNGYISSHDLIVNNTRSNANFYAIYMYDADVTINGGYFYSESLYDDTLNQYLNTINVYYNQNLPGTLTINHGYFSSNYMLESYNLSTLATPIADTEHNATYNYSKQ